MIDLLYLLCLRAGRTALSRASRRFPAVFVSRKSARSCLKRGSLGPGGVRRLAKGRCPRRSGAEGP
eukprot:3298442-Alexandrium_andersonii.AAC.1